MPAKQKKIGSKATRTLSKWYRVQAAALEELPHDLSTRQMAILLHIYITPPPHNIKAITKQLPISKAASCRAIDVLENANLLRRAVDRRDRRNILLLPTAKGKKFLREFSSMIASAAK